MSINPILNSVNTPANRNPKKDSRTGAAQPEKRVKASIFYLNDIHGKSINMERLASVSNTFDSFQKSQPDVDRLKLSSGDIQLGHDEKINEVAVKFQNAIGIQATAMGNHEFDLAWKKSGKLLNLLEQIQYKLLANNVYINNSEKVQNKLQNYTIEEINGHKYGIIGTSPVDLISRLRQGTLTENLRVHSLDETIKQVQRDADELKKQGVDKIILLSHVGYEGDILLARATDGIDIILGGHSHDLLRDIKEGKNLFYSKSNEPVIITQGGRDGTHFGILNVEFDEKGIIKKAQNNISYTDYFRRNAPMRYIFETILGKPEKIGYIESAEKPPKKVLTEPTGHANFILDCMKEDCDAEIAIMPSPEIRGFFDEGTLDTRTLNEILPFKNKAVVVNYTEKEIVDAIKFASTSLQNKDNKPGIMEVSGLEYRTNKDGDLLSMAYIDKNGTKTPIDINNPRQDKLYKTVINDFHAQGNDNYTMLNKFNEAEKICDYDITGCVINCVKKHNTPIKIADDGRIQIAD